MYDSKDAQRKEASSLRINEVKQDFRDGKIAKSGDTDGVKSFWVGHLQVHYIVYQEKKVHKVVVLVILHTIRGSYASLLYWMDQVIIREDP